MINKSLSLFYCVRITKLLLKISVSFISVLRYTAARRIQLLIREIQFSNIPVLKKKKKKGRRFSSVAFFLLASHVKYYSMKARAETGYAIQRLRDCSHPMAFAAQNVGIQ
jgi:hypothetical protein